MQAYTIGVVVEASREILEDAPNAASLMQSVLATALPSEWTSLHCVAVVERNHWG